MLSNNVNNAKKVSTKEDNMTEGEVREFIEKNDFLLAFLNHDKADEVIDNYRTEVSEKEIYYLEQKRQLHLEKKKGKMIYYLNYMEKKR